MSSQADILAKLAHLHVRREKLNIVRRQLYFNHRIQLDRIQGLETQLKLKQDIAFRELGYSMKQEHKEYYRVSHEDMFPLHGPLNLESYNFLD